MQAPDELSEKFRQWATLKKKVDVEISRMNKLRDDMMETVISQGDQDETGSSHLPLPVPIDIGDKTYNAIKREARTSTVLNEERALAMAEERGILNEVTVSVTTIDLDLLYASWQRGKLSDAEIDSLFDTKTNYAFKSVAA